MVRDEVFEREEAQIARGAVGQLHEARQHRGHLEPGELDLRRLRVAHPHRQVEREAGDVGEGVSRVDGQRHEHGEDLLGEDLIDACAVGVVEIGPGLHMDARLVERRLDEVVEGARVPVLQLEREAVDAREHVRGHAPRVGRHGEAGHDAPLKTGDAHHEELVEIRGEDREEVHALEQGNRRVLRELEHALIEVQPAQLAVEIAVGGQRAVIDARGLVVVVGEVSAHTTVDLIVARARALVVHHDSLTPPGVSRATQTLMLVASGRGCAGQAVRANDIDSNLWMLVLHWPRESPRWATRRGETSCDTCSTRLAAARQWAGSPST